MTVLFVCTGNIHRSALAEAMLKAALERDLRSDVEVLSAGSMAIDGLPAVPRAVALAREEGLDLAAHRARRLSDAPVARADMIVVMEASHRELPELERSRSDGRVRLLSEFADSASGLPAGADIPDADARVPGSFRTSYSIIQSCVSRLYRELPPAPQEVYLQAVEDRFRLLRKSVTGLSSAEWNMADRWWTRRVPLWMVLEAMDEIIGEARRKGRGGTRRLGSCREAVEERFAAFLASRPAGHERVSHEEPEVSSEDLLGRAGARLREARSQAQAAGHAQAAAFIKDAEESLLAVEDGADMTEAEIRLRLLAIEERLIEEMRQVAPPETIASARGQACRSLDAYRDRMTTAAFEATVERMVAETLLRLYGVPRLSEV